MATADAIRAKVEVLTNYLSENDSAIMVLMSLDSSDALDTASRIQ